MKFLSIYVLIFSSFSFTQEHTIYNVLTDSIFSKHLNEYRKFTVYLPQTYDKNETYPVIYTTDGQILTEKHYFRPIDSLIKLKIIRPLVLICVHSKEKTVEGDFMEYRNYEYIKSISDSKKVNGHNLFAEHLQFFTTEIIPFIEKKYTVSTNKSEKYFYGSSNGAAFGVELSLKFPELFKNYILMSVISSCASIEDYLKKTPKKDLIINYNHFYGDQEEFCINEDQCLNKLKSNPQVKITSQKYQGGHERVKWAENFIEYLKNNLK